MAGIVLGIVLGLVTYFALLEPFGEVWAVVLAAVVLLLVVGSPYIPTRRP